MVDNDANNLLINTEKEKIQPQTGKARKQVRFDISKDDEEPDVEINEIEL